MRTNPSISVQSVGKRFGRTARSARVALTSLLQTPAELARGRGVTRRESEPAWALRDVSFEVGQGEVLGVVGRNGAGKSVLLKIIARVARPTEGRVEVSGHVAPLLGVGTGFHHELTGRENIYLNGVILGMRRAEVHRRVDEIVAFAGVGDALDTAIKRYSSGMRMRLAFAVAAHLDRDIFLLDEVFAVGDREFQVQCEARMKEMAREGKTIVLVHHGAHVVQQLCSRALLLDLGRVVADGTPAAVMRQYEGVGGREGSA
jgi:lipopolysaccharide transport system ATP-binding protein